MSRHRERTKGLLRPRGPVGGMLLAFISLLGGGRLLEGAVPPTLTVDPNSSQVLITGGGLHQIPAHTVTMGAEPGNNTFTTDTFFVIPEITYAFGERISVIQEHPTSATVDPNGTVVINTILKVSDDGGASLELPAKLTTGDLGNDFLMCDDSSVFCFPGFPGGPYCLGSPWNPATGKMRLVGFIKIPLGQGSQIEGRCITLEIEGTIEPSDTDSDGVKDLVDNCPGNANAAQQDGDADGVGNLCDNCSAVKNVNQSNFDGDAAGDACDPFLINYQPCTLPIPAGHDRDCGQVYSGVRGYGWNSAMTCIERGINPDRRLDTFCESSGTATWELDLAPGDYDISATVGDALQAAGPHRVVAEGVALFNGVTTSANTFQNATKRVHVRDGRLTVEVGGGGGTTRINSVYVTWLPQAQQPKRLYAFDFLPSGAPVPIGFSPATEAQDDNFSRWGWSRPVTAIDENASSYQVFDAVVLGSDELFEAEVIKECYVVQACAGDTFVPEGPHRVTVEGQTIIDDAGTLAGEFVCGAAPMMVEDGRLTVGIGAGTPDTAINFVTAATTPFDFDGDSSPIDPLGNCDDNCPSVYNPTQADHEGDAIGDICDPDDDNDLSPDGSDCAPLDAGAFATPTSVTGVRVTGGGTATVVWDSQDSVSGTSTTYGVLKGPLSAVFRFGNFTSATCVAGLTDPMYVDGVFPPLANGTYYLVGAENVCGVSEPGPGLICP